MLLVSDIDVVLRNPAANPIPSWHPKVGGFFMKSPPVQYSDDEAKIAVEAFIAGTIERYSAATAARSDVTPD